jgi:hypothetical protein
MLLDGLQRMRKKLKIDAIAALEAREGGATIPSALGQLTELVDLGLGVQGINGDNPTGACSFERPNS